MRYVSILPSTSFRIFIYSLTREKLLDSGEDWLADICQIRTSFGCSCWNSVTICRHSRCSKQFQAVHEEGVGNSCNPSPTLQFLVIVVLVETSTEEGSSLNHSELEVSFWDIPLLILRAQDHSATDGCVFHIAIAYCISPMAITSTLYNCSAWIKHDCSDFSSHVTRSLQPLRISAAFFFFSSVIMLLAAQWPCSSCFCRQQLFVQTRKARYWSVLFWIKYILVLWQEISDILGYEFLYLHGVF